MTSKRDLKPAETCPRCGGNDGGWSPSQTCKRCGYDAPMDLSDTRNWFGSNWTPELWEALTAPVPDPVKKPAEMTGAELISAAFDGVEEA